MSYRGGDRGRGGGGGYGGRGGGRGGRGGPPDFRGRGGPPGRGGGFRGGPPRGRGGIFAPGGPVNVDNRLSNNSEDRLVAALRGIQLNDESLPVRPDFGTVGKVIKLRTNFFPVTPPKQDIYDYDVAISPASDNRRVKRRLFRLAEATKAWADAGMTGKVAHDFSSRLVSSFELPQPLTIEIALIDEEEQTQGPATASKKPGAKKDKGPKVFTLTFNLTRSLETASLMSHLEGERQYRNYDINPVVAALNILLMAHPNRLNGTGVMVGRNKFFHPSQEDPPFDIGGGLEAWRGFYTSVRPAHKQLMVNVNVCTTAFYKTGNLADRMYEFMQASFGARPAAFAKGVRVKTIHLGFQKSIKSVSKLNARQHSFDAEGMGRVTVEQYFKRKYQITLRYPELPLVDVGGQKANLLPPELCEILEKQPFRGKLLDEHTSEMIKVACNPPNLNAQAIVGRGLRELGFTQAVDPLRAFGIRVGNEMAVVPGRILPSPKIRYGQGAPLVDERASWNLRNVKFAVGGRLINWGVLLIADNGRDEFSGPSDPALSTIITGFRSMCKDSGMNVDPGFPQIVMARMPAKDPQGDPIRMRCRQVIRDTLRTMNPKPTVVLVILSSGDRHIYAGIKHLCDVILDVATVCVQVGKIRKERGQLQYYANVALKLNMKMGGVNHTLEHRNSQWMKQKPTMLVGMDVTHPGYGTIKDTPSIAAVVASVDVNFGQFPASLRIQESKKEMITDLCGMMVERITAFRNKSRVLPARVIVYRDGVSEGQFNIVKQDELPEIKKAFKKFSDGTKPYLPQLTIVICGKRHHTRFYPTEPGQADRDGNPLPGTVVDRGVTAIYEFDFFLQAHGGLQGTTRPTHYYVVHDENEFKADQLQTLTNDVSYMFSRATKAVSLASPAYYADLACERGRCYLHSLLNGVSPAGTTVGSATAEEVMAEAKRMWSNGVGRGLSETMFYL